MSKVSRYNPNKRGSYQIELKFYDWELSILIGTIRKEMKRIEKRIERNSKLKGYKTYLEKLDKKLSEALGLVLKAEFRDLKMKSEDIDKYLKGL